MYFLETSAKESDNVERLFMEIAVELMEVTFDYIMKSYSNLYINTLSVCSKLNVKNYLDTTLARLPSTEKRLRSETAPVAAK